MSQPHNSLVSPSSPPSGLSTPSEMPGTPNSTTTSLSALSTVAIKDGHRGSAHPHAYPFPFNNSVTSPTSTSHTSMLAAERADRISRLPGFAPNMAGAITKSTVGSASATGSAGGRTMDGSGIDDRGSTVDGSVLSEQGDSGSVTESDSGFGRGGVDIDGESNYYDARSEVGTDMAVDGGSERASTVGGSQFGGPQVGQAQIGQIGQQFVGQGAGQTSAVGEAERITRRLDNGGLGLKGNAMQTPDGEGLGKFYFEGEARR